MEFSESPLISRPENKSPEERTVQLQTDLTAISSRYGIVVELSEDSERKTDRLGFGRSISYETVPEIDAAVPVRAIRTQLGLYPPEYIRALRILRIKPVRNFSESHFAMGQIQDLGGIPIPKQGLIYMDVVTGHEVYVAENLHHEANHFTDNDFAGFKGRKRRGEWVKLNPKGTDAYEVNSKYFSNRDVDTERPEGFASLYGSFNFVEDRAEVAKLIMMMGGTPYLGILMEKDEVLRTKVITTLAYMNEKSGGKIPVNFLDDLERKIVNENYWDNK